MKFKTYLNTDKELLLEFSAHGIPELISRLMIPLSPILMKKLGYFEADKIAYHLTNFNKYFDMIYKNQGKKGQISCFTKGGFELTRIPSQPDILIKLQGEMIIGGDTDIWTVPSSRGVRWLDHSGRGGAKLDFYIEGILVKIFKEFSFDINPQSESQIKDTILELNNKEQIQFYKRYLEEIEGYINKGGYKELNKYLKNAAEMSYNEVVMERIQILDVSCVEIERDYIINKLRDLKITYGGLINYHDIKKIKH